GRSATSREDAVLHQAKFGHAYGCRLADAAAGDGSNDQRAVHRAGEPKLSKLTFPMEPQVIRDQRSVEDALDGMASAFEIIERGRHLAPDDDEDELVAEQVAGVLVIVHVGIDLRALRGPDLRRMD